MREKPSTDALYEIFTRGSRIPLAEVKRKTEGLSIFLVDKREALGRCLTMRPIRNMVNHETNELFFENLEIPAENLIGEEGKGFRYILDGMNAERILIAAECIGDGYWFVDRAAKYASERVVFDRPIGQNQGVQFPIAEAHIEVEAADLMRWEACRRRARRGWPGARGCPSRSRRSPRASSPCSGSRARCARWWSRRRRRSRTALTRRRR